MKYQIIGDSDCPVARIDLGTGERVRIERGSMVYSRDIDLEGQMNGGKGGLKGALGAIGRSLTAGESMFITTATGSSDRSEIVIAPTVPGKIVELECGHATQYRLNTGAFVACDEGMGYRMVKQGIGKAFFAGTGGFFVMETNGEGIVLASAFGDVIPVDVAPDRPVTIDNEHVVAWDASLEYSVRVASGIFGFTTGEGLVNDFSGSGRVYIQTRSLQNMAHGLIPFLPDKTSNN